MANAYLSGFMIAWFIVFVFIEPITEQLRKMATEDKTLMQLEFVKQPIPAALFGFIMGICWPYVVYLLFRIFASKVFKK